MANPIAPLHEDRSGRKNPCMLWVICTGRQVEWSRRRAVSATILSIDLGRFNSVMCECDPADQSPRFRHRVTVGISRGKPAA
jgi:hypothetical protein